jgi:hypothetical protein
MAEIVSSSELFGNNNIVSSADLFKSKDVISSKELFKNKSPWWEKTADFLTGHFGGEEPLPEIVNGGPNPNAPKPLTGFPRAMEATTDFLQDPITAVTFGAVGGVLKAGSLATKALTGASETASWATGGFTDIPKLASQGGKAIVKGMGAKPLAELRAAREASGIVHATVPISAKTGKPVVEALADTAPKVVKTADLSKAQEGKGTKTGTRKEIVNSEISQSGRPEIERPINERIAPDDVKTKVDSGEINPRAMAEDISKKPRALSADEFNALGYDRAILKNEHARLESLIDNARTKGDVDAEIKLLDEQTKIYEHQKNNDAALSVGQEQWGRAGLALQNEVTVDYSFSRMIIDAEKRKGRALTIEERQKYKVMSAKITEYETKIAQHEAKIAALESQKTFSKIKNDIALEQRKIKRVYTKVELDTELDGLFKELNATLSQIHANPVLNPDIYRLYGSIAKNRVRAGFNTMEGLIDEVYTIGKNYGLTLTKREVSDAISKYGVVGKLSKDEINIQLRELKRQMRLTSALEDASKGITPLRSGQLRDAKSDKVLKLEKEVRQAMRENGIDVTKVRTEEEQWKTAQQSFITRTTNRIAELEGKLKTGDFSTKQKRERTLSQQELDLKFAKDKVVKEYQKAKIEDTLARRSFLTKSKDFGMEVLNVARAVKTSMDLSAVLRQGGFVALGHPIRGIKAMPDMFRALRSEKGQFAVEQAIMKRANYSTYEKSGLYLSEHGQKLSQMEEAYMSHWAEKIPGVAASGRAYTTYLNVLRADSFDAMLKNLPAVAGKATPEETKAIANFINIATGRGNLGAKENALVGLNTVFFAPRYVASRFQLMMGSPLKGGTWTTKKMIAKEYARFFVGLSAVYGIAIASGAKIGVDPHSSDFGKIIIGKTRIDPMAGLSQTTTFTTRVLSGDMSQSGKGYTLSLDGIKGQGSHAMDPRQYGNVWLRFLRSKVAPVPGAAWNWKTKEDVVGNKIERVGDVEDFMQGTSIPSNLLMPLALSDIYQTMQEQGIPKGTAMALLSIFGMGVQTYNKQ